jgi:lipopolysaccharide/colanic/teichoic acid biosynthesis glycosyltransferase/glycosyltransferase involved in cell wall biosynthesis
VDHVPRLSGAEQSLADLVAGLAQGPVEPIVALPSDGPLAARLRASGVLVRTVPMSKRLLETSRETLSRSPFAVLARMFAFIGASWRIFRLMRQTRPAIVHTNTLKSHLIAMLPCAITRTPLVWHVRDILPRGWLQRAFTQCARLATIIIVPSRACAEPFRSAKQVLRKVRLVPNGIRVEEFWEARDDRSLREMMAVSASDPVIGIVGRIAPWKGQETFVRAAAMLAVRYPRAHFAVIGAPLFEQDHMFERHLLNMVNQLGIADRVSFLGFQPAPEAMAACDVVVHASTEPEPFGRTIVEAMAAGKPVVCADGGAIREIVPPAAGFVVPPSRPELLADALDRLLADKKLRKRMGEAGAAVADNFFPVQRTVQSVAQIYRHLAALHARRAAKRARLARKLPLPKPKPQQPQQPMSWPRGPVANGNAPRDAAPRPRGGEAAPAPRPQRAREDVPRRSVKKRPPVPHAERERFEPPVAAISNFDDFDDFIPPSDDMGPSADFDPWAPPASRRRSVAALKTAPRVRARVAQPEPAVAVPALAEANVVLQPVLVPGLAPVLPDVTFERKPPYEVIKRFIDLLLSLGALVAGLPLWLFIAVAIKLESRGPVFHRGVVHGVDGKPFTYFKFRSMRIDGSDKAHRKFIERYVRENGGHEHGGEVVYKLMGDDRVTAVGRWIRKFSLDEIPQLLNVARGEMSIVGPRPPLDYEYELYDERAQQRLRVPPGITGMQQVWFRHTASFEAKLQMDLNYIRQRSTWLDLKLIAHTFLAMARGH